MDTGVEWFRRGGAIAGTVAPLLWLAAMIAAPSDTPSDDAAAADVVTFFAENGAQLRIATFVMGVSLVGLLWFTAVLRDVLGVAEGRHASVASLAYGAWIVFIVLDFVALLIYPGLLASDAFTSKADPELVRTWYLLVRGVEPGLWEIVAVGSTFALVAAFAATSYGILRWGGLPKWLGWFGAFVAVGFAAATLEVLGGRIREAAGIFGYLTYFLVFRVWLASAGVALFIRSMRATSVLETQAGPP